METIEVINGDIFESNADIITHQTNCLGVMGGGVALQVKQKYPKVFREYEDLCNQYKQNPYFLLGNVQLCRINPQQQICNIFGQKDFSRFGCSTDYDSLKLALRKLNVFAIRKTVAIPYLMSCGLAGGNWDIVNNIIGKVMTDCDVTYYKYGD